MSPDSLLLLGGEEVEDHLRLVAGVTLVVGIDALAVLEEEGTAAGHADKVLHAKSFGDGLLLLVGEEAEGKILLFLEFFLELLVVGAHAQDVDASLLEVGPTVAQRAALLGATASLGLRVEKYQEVALGAFLGEGDGLAVLVVAGDVRDGGADGELFSRVTEEGEEGHEEGSEESLHVLQVGRPPVKGKRDRRCFVSLVRLSGGKNKPMLQAVLDTIPHRPPFLFLDRIDEVRADGATCSRTFRADEPFYSGHYPGNPITPGVLLCESVFQTGAIFLTKKLQSEGGVPSGKTPVLCRIEEAKFKGMVMPSDTVSIDVKLVETLQQFHFMTGTVRRDGKAVLTIRFALALVDQPA